MSEHALSGKIALVTGASRGLGVEVVRQLAAAGASVAAVARDAAGLADAVAAAEGARVSPGQRFAAVPADLADLGSLSDVVARAIRDCGGDAVDVLVNNAAYQGPIGVLDAVDFDQWRAVFDVNLFAPVRLCQLVLPGMRRRGRGKIINLSGGGGTAPRPDFSAYATTKCAIVRLTETLAVELKGTGIDVNAVAPGAMNTRMLQETLAAGPGLVRHEYDKAVQQQQSGGAPPAKAAALIAHLASPASDGISGRLIAAMWDDWATLAEHKAELNKSDVYTLRRILPKERGMTWGG
ncbi:MAG TPA: SDR family oxidoreductase [Tepidisphaeraceae bacterium]|nr:SDR family oxidoreductase [Tepidisphaeraceae bacterium]